MKKRIVFFAILLSLIICCTVCPAEEEIIDKIVAVVNNELITLSDLKKVTGIMFAALDQQEGISDSDKAFQRAELEKRALEQLIERKLIEQKAKEFDLKVTEKEFNDAMQDILARNSITLDQLKEVLKKDGTTLEEYQKMLKSEILQSKVIGREIKSRITITDKDVEQYYEANIKPREKLGEKVHIQQIFLPIPPGSSSAQIEKLNAQMEEVRKEILSGKDFGDMASRYSQDPSAGEGGDLGYFHRGELLPAIEQTAFSLKKGELSQVITTSFGIHLIKILDRQEESDLQDWKSRRDEIENIIYRQEVENLFQKWMEDLKKNAYIKSYL